MNVNVLSGVQELGDLGLACVLCLAAEQHGIILADQDELDDAAQQLAMICSEELELATVVIECGQGTNLDHFRENILIDNPAIEPDSAPLSKHRFGAQEISLDERRVADVIIAKNLDQADHHVQIQALELVRSGRMYTRTAMHSTGKSFLLLALNAHRSSVPAFRHLNDLFALAHYHQAEAGNNDSETSSYRSKVSGDSASLRSLVRGNSSVSHTDPVDPRRLTPDIPSRLRSLANNVTMTAEVSAYLQNVIVALRLHRYVAGGISALATRHMRIVTRALAVLHGLDYVTPAIVGLAVRKVYLHRLVLADEHTERSLRWGSDVDAVRQNMLGVTVEHAIDAVLASVQSPL